MLVDLFSDLCLNSLLPLTFLVYAWLFFASLAIV
jgi:hypothetical protein